MPQLCALGAHVQPLGLGGLPLQLGLGHIGSGHHSGLVAVFGQLQRLFIGLHRHVEHGQLLVSTAHRQIGLHQGGLRRQTRCGQVLAAGLQTGVGRTVQTTHPAPQIHLPRNRCAQAVIGTGHRGRCVFAARHTHVGIHRGKQAGLGRAHCGLGLAHPSSHGLQVVVAQHQLPLQIVQHRVLKQLPPGRVGGGHLTGRLPWANGRWCGQAQGGHGLGLEPTAGRQQQGHAEQHASMG